MRSIENNKKLKMGETLSNYKRWMSMCIVVGDPGKWPTRQAGLHKRDAYVGWTVIPLWKVAAICRSWRRGPLRHRCSLQIWVGCRCCIKRLSDDVNGGDTINKCWRCIAQCACMCGPVCVYLSGNCVRETEHTKRLGECGINCPAPRSS